MLRKILFSGLFMSSLLAVSCWNTQEKALQEEAELDGKIVFSFKDAVTCEPITKADISFLNNHFITNNKGEVRMPIPPDDLDDNIPIFVKKNGYIPLKQNIIASVGSYWQHRFLLSKTIPIHSVRFVLNWGETPKDLDLHLISDDFHISYRNKILSTQAKLDRDARNGYGPETITLNNLNENKNYKLYVYKYSANGNLDHNVHVSVYKNNELNKVVNLPDNISGKCIQILDIQNNRIHYDIKTVPDNFCRVK